MFLSCAVFYGLLCQLKIESQWVLVAKILSGGIMAFTGIKLLEKKYSNKLFLPAERQSYCSCP